MTNSARRFWGARLFFPPLLAQNGDPFFRYLPAYYTSLKEMGGSDARTKFDHPAAVVVAHKMDNCVVVRLGKALSI